ncbi:MAG: hypothetical protein CL440_09090 [Acidimicrobiaceae bacterium]|nr:hypothetical protein [Acidimicrobiaceae bacterium]
MVSLTRLTLWIAVILGSLLFLILQGDAGLVTRVAGGVVLLALVSLLMFSGRSPVPRPAKASSTKIVVESDVKKESKVEVDLPEPVLEVESASQRREGKIKRSRGKSPEPVMPLPAPPVAMPPPVVTDDGDVSAPMPVITEDSNVAARYVAEANPQGDFEAEVEEFVGQRRAKRAEIRSRIERKRRMKMAERRAAKARMWSAVEDGEDLAELLKRPDHGMTVFDEPESPDSTKPQGVSYVRIDEERILRIRIPLEVKHREVSRKKDEEEAVDEVSPMPPPPGMPPMPPPPGMPPMPPPSVKTDEG